MRLGLNRHFEHRECKPARPRVLHDIRLPFPIIDKPTLERTGTQLHDPFAHSSLSVKHGRVGTAFSQVSVQIFTLTIPLCNLLCSFLRKFEVCPGIFLPSPPFHPLHNIRPFRKMTYELQRTILAWGSHAVNLMVSGSLKEASHAWSCALLYLVLYLEEPDWDDRHSDDNDELSSSFSSSGLVVRSVDVSCSAVSADQDRIFSVFHRSIVYVIDDTSTERLWTLLDYRRVATSTVYNLALTHHLQGLQGGAGNNAALNRALRAYRSAREVLSLTMSGKMAATTASKMPEDLRLLHLAIANNEGHLCERAFDADRVDVCLRQLHDVLPYTWWVTDFQHFHETAFLFPRQSSLRLHAPMA